MAIEESLKGQREGKGELSEKDVHVLKPRERKRRTAHKNPPVKSLASGLRFFFIFFLNCQCYHPFFCQVVRLVISSSLISPTIFAKYYKVNHRSQKVGWETNGEDSFSTCLEQDSGKTGQDKNGISLHLMEQGEERTSLRTLLLDWAVQHMVKEREIRQRY